jgi:hypothetical protein
MVASWRIELLLPAVTLLFCLDLAGVLHALMRRHVDEARARELALVALALLVDDVRLELVRDDVHLQRARVGAEITALERVKVGRGGDV